MNLKESFRYQNYLDTLMSAASASVRSRAHCLVVQRLHKRSEVNSDAEDITETVEVEDHFANDDVLKFMLMLIDERQKLTNAIGAAKVGLSFDLDAALETNKFRQSFVRTVRDMLHYTGSKSTDRGVGYKFNVNGDQTEYYYDIDVVTSEAFDRASAKAVSRQTIMESDKVSSEIDQAMTNTTVDYQPPFDVNDSFEDAMESFLTAQA